MLQIDFAPLVDDASPLALGVAVDGTVSGVGKHDRLARLLAEKALAMPRFQGKNKGFGEVVTALRPSGWLIMLGLGERKDAKDSLRGLGGALYWAAARLGEETLSAAFDLDPESIAELAYGARLRSWKIDWRSREIPEKRVSLKRAIFATSSPERATARFKRLEAAAEGVAFARDLVAAPGGALGPKAFANRLKKFVKLGIDVDILDKKSLKSEGLGLLLAVGRGSRTPPCMAVLQWRGGAPSDAPLLLVGKGITFDSGGIDIKPALHMEEMKGDMAGAAAVAGAILAAAKRKAPITIAGVIAIAENMPSGSATHPGDVVKSHAGLSVEILDTDAEGRLALADALSYGVKRFAPKVIVDLATLTGSVVVALGTKRAGLFCNNDALAKKLIAIGEDEGERLWRMPLTDYYDDALKSDIADIRNCCWETPSPDCLHAARFLERFVPKDIPWAHLDIAGVSETEEEIALFAKGPTGFGVRILDRLADMMDS